LEQASTGTYTCLFSYFVNSGTKILIRREGGGRPAAWRSRCRGDDEDDDERCGADEKL